MCKSSGDLLVNWGFSVNVQIQKAQYIQYSFAFELLISVAQQHKFLVVKRREFPLVFHRHVKSYLCKA